jgi:hypothetical protein
VTDFAIQDIFELKIAFHDLKAKEKGWMTSLSVLIKAVLR